MIVHVAECRNGDVQLVNSYGVASQQGRVEICLDQRWNNVCDEWWTEKDASVVCKQLGYTGYKTIGTHYVYFVECSLQYTKLL